MPTLTVIEADVTTHAHTFENPNSEQIKFAGAVNIASGANITSKRVGFKMKVKGNEKALAEARALGLI